MKLLVKGEKKIYLEDSGVNLSSPVFAFSIDFSAIPLQLTHHCGIRRGSMTSFVLEQSPILITFGAVPRYNPYCN